MKLKVRPEGREGVWIIEKTDLIKWLMRYKEKQIHCFLGSIGADWQKKNVIDHIKESDRNAILTGDSQKNNLCHAVSSIRGNTRYMFDIGEITEEDLQPPPTEPAEGEVVDIVNHPELGDTYIDYQKDQPAKQWMRIAVMLSEQGLEVTRTPKRR